MSKIKRIMVGLDLTATDRQVIQYTAFINYYYQPEKIYFINVQSNLDLPEEIMDEYEEAHIPLDEKIKKEMMVKVEKYYPDHSKEVVDYQIIEGSPRREILRWSHIKQIDLLIMGRKKTDHGSGIVPQQLARKISCSILFVPEHAPLILRNIIVGNDFSANSKAAMEAALEFKEVDPEIHILSDHVFSVPYGYYRTGKTEGQFATIIEGYAKTKFEYFLADGPKTLELAEPVFTYDAKKSSPANQLYHTAKKKSADMIVIGARGVGAVTALLLGSVTEKLISINSEIPTLIVKRKEKAFSFMDLIEST